MTEKVVPSFDEDGATIWQGDALTVLRQLADESAQCCVTSPPYWGLRDYGIEGQLGLESTPEEYVARIVEIFGEVRRVLRDDGTLWLNLGDSYAATTKGSGGHNPEQDRNAGAWHGDRQWRIPGGLKPKDLVGIPWRVAFALQADGWYLRSDIIWHKPNPMPESVTDRPTKAHEYVFLMAKSEKYYYDADAIAEKSRTGNPTGEIRNKRSVWTITTDPYPEAHFATFPRDLVVPCIKAGCPAGGVVLDPFCGSGPVLQVARELGCRGVGIDLNPKYCKLIDKRLAQQVLMLEAVYG